MIRGRDHPSTGSGSVCPFICILVALFRRSSLFCICSTTDVHTVASLLKLYLRQLPEPLVPYSCYQNFLFCAQKLSTDRTLVTVPPFFSHPHLTFFRSLPAMQNQHSSKLIYCPPTMWSRVFNMISNPYRKRFIEF